jgi:hypothetical protein
VAVPPRAIPKIRLLKGDPRVAGPDLPCDPQQDRIAVDANDTRRGHSVEYPSGHRATSTGEVQHPRALKGEGAPKDIRHCPEPTFAIGSIQILLRIPCG